MLIQNMTREKTCKWCGRTFRVPMTREYNATKYCCVKCSYFAQLEQKYEWIREYRKKYGTQFSIGTSNFKEKRFKDFEREMKAIRKEMKRLGL
ncbi:hypothetical protein PXD04_10105 [Methanosphaera sp. ISO3-F5]|uniref:hypothetical protein n=1 Tax=Methanosphaera sp. ISO3-F5 TaxID=1452353 RepID=UPI002B25EF44|nr:hypothetical protein [Methanosphaera sp. ISO3-F5]WQH64042.1 hypothetical protein PXD04_10105 [Methanosphaera sp. ISO3-F5]